MLSFRNIIYILFFLGMYSCAIRGAGPIGGDQDVTPPKVLAEKPANKSTAFNKDKITVTFDEYIELSNQQREITITPSLEVNPEIFLSGKSIIINTADINLASNTTYVIQFGQAIRDINEGNILPNFRYVFSTGNYIDSLFIKGNALDAITGKVPEKLLVSLYKADANDSAIFKTKPLYFTSADAEGNFTLENLPKGNYKIYALADANQNYHLDANEAVGFYQNVIAVDTSVTLNATLQIFQNQVGELVLKKAYTDNRKNTFKFSQSVDSLYINNNLIDFSSSRVFLNNKQDSIVLFKIVKNDTFTGSSIHLLAKNAESILDSTLQNIDIQKDTLNLQLNLIPAAESGNKYSSPLAFQSNYPIKTVNSSLAYLLEDSIKVKFNTISFTDSSRTVLVFFYPFDEEKHYNYVIENNAFTSVFNQKSDSMRGELDLPLRKNFGLVEVNVSRPDTIFSYIFEIVKAGGEAIYSKSISRTEKIRLPFIIPGEYRMRLIKDENKNGRWDAGNVINRLPPEEIIYSKNDLNIKANWELMDVVFEF